MKMSLVLPIGLMLVLWAPLEAHAQYLTGDRSAPAPEMAAPEVWGYQDVPYTHDRGVMARLSLGPSYATSRSYVDDERSISFSGAALDLYAAVGGIVAQDVALHITALGNFMIQPRSRIAGEAVETSTGGVQLFGVAPGVTLFLANGGYFSPSIGLSVLRVRFDDADLDQPEALAGFLFDIHAGKEWWVGERASSGLGARITVHTVPSNLAEPFRGVSVGAAWTFTWN